MGWVGVRIRVIAVRGKGGREVPARCACARADCGPIAVVIHVLVPGRAPDGAIFVDEAIAVVVDAVTRFSPARKGVRGGVVAVAAIGDVASRRAAGGYRHGPVAVSVSV